MLNKSYTEFKKLLEEQGYYFNSSVLDFISVDYNNDGWNYKGVDMFSNLKQGINTIQSDSFLSNISIEKRSFFPIQLPRIMVAYCNSGDEIVQFYTVGPYIFLINTSKKNNMGKIEINKKYSVGTKSIFKFFNSIIKIFLIKTNIKLMESLTFKLLNN